MPVVRNPQFYFKEGFCWIDVNSTYLKARIKANGVFDVLSMSLFTMTQLPDWYYVSLINSEFISLYVDSFVNNTSHFQINDARQLPIIIPNKDVINEIKQIAEKSILEKKNIFSSTTIEQSTAEKRLNTLQMKLNTVVLCLYDI